MELIFQELDGAVDCGSVGGSTARWSHVASGLYRETPRYRPLATCDDKMAAIVTMAAILSWWDG